MSDDLTMSQVMALANVIGHLSVCGDDPSVKRRLNVARIHTIIDAFPQMEFLRQDYTGETDKREPLSHHGTPRFDPPAIVSVDIANGRGTVVTAHREGDALHIDSITTHDVEGNTP